MTDRPHDIIRRLQAVCAAVLFAALGANAQTAPPEPRDAQVTLAVFNACNTNRGCELWITDGTRAGTAMVRNIATGAGSSNPQNLTALGGGRVLFSAHVPAGHTGFNYNPWITDGTRAGTRLLRPTRLNGEGSPFPPVTLPPSATGSARPSLRAATAAQTTS